MKNKKILIDLSLIQKIRGHLFDLKGLADVDEAVKCTDTIQSLSALIDAPQEQEVRTREQILKAQAGHELYHPDGNVYVLKHMALSAMEEYKNQTGKVNKKELTKDDIEILAEEHARATWGKFYDDVADYGTDQTNGEISKKDFIAGFEKAQSLLVL